MPDIILPPDDGKPQKPVTQPSAEPTPPPVKKHNGVPPDNRISFISTTVAKDFVERSTAFMVADLARSGLDPNDIPVVPESQPGVCGPCYRIKYFMPDGTPCPLMWRQRNSEGDKKYLSAQRVDAGDLVLMPFFHPKRVKGTGPYCIVEGEKKYAKLQKEEKVYGCGIGGKDLWTDGNGHLHPLLVEDIEASGMAQVLIVPDGDWRRQDIFSSYSQLAFKLKERFPDKQILFADLSGHRLPNGDRVGADDYLMLGLKWSDVPIVDLENELLLSKETLIERFSLDFDANMKTGARTIRNNHSNVEKLLRLHPMFNEHALWFNMDDDMPVFQASTSNTFVRITVALQRYCHMPKVGLDIVCKTSPLIVEERVKSPLLERIKAFQHDDINWIGQAATVGFQTDREPEAYRYEAVKRLFLQAIARKARPGCKADTVPVLIAAQGKHKSMLWEVLSYGSYCTVISDPTDRDQEMRIHGKWFAVFEEMEWPSKVEAEKYKRFVTETQGYYRAPYAAAFVTKPRHNVFVGNTNTETLLRDVENRREMPFYVSNIDIEWFKEHLDQLWAQAWKMYCDGVKWWSDDESVWEEAKSAFREEVPHKVKIEDTIRLVLEGDFAIRVPKDHKNPIVAGKTGFTFDRLEYALGDTKINHVNLSRYLTRLGWIKVRIEVDGKQVMVWFEK